MTKEQLKEANQIQDELSELNYFIQNAETLWTGKLKFFDTFKYRIKMWFMMNAYGAIEGMSYELNNEMKDRVLQLLYERREELQDKMKSI